MNENIGRQSNPGLAALFSLIIPGAGQVYQRRVLAGFFWLIIVTGGYLMFVVPGLILHIACVLSAAMTNPSAKTT